MQTELWGEFNNLSLAYLVIVNGQSYMAGLVAKDKESGTRDHWFEAFNFSGVLGEWAKIKAREKRNYEVFFEKNKFKTSARRIHMYITEKFLQDNTKVPKKTSSSMGHPLLHGVQDSKLGPLTCFGQQIFFNTEELDLKPQGIRLLRLFIEDSQKEDRLFYHHEMMAAISPDKEVSKKRVQSVISEIRQVLSKYKKNFEIKRNGDLGYCFVVKNIR
jgi:hypothetical protein